MELFFLQNLGIYVFSCSFGCKDFAIMDCFDGVDPWYELIISKSLLLVPCSFASFQLYLNLIVPIAVHFRCLNIMDLSFFVIAGF